MIEISQNGLYVTWINYNKMYKTFCKQENAEMNVRTLDAPDPAANVGRAIFSGLYLENWFRGKTQRRKHIFDSDAFLKGNMIEISQNGLYMT